VHVDTIDGRRLEGRVDEPKGDPGNTLERHELEEKATRLALYRDGATAAEMQSVIGWAWSLMSVARVGILLEPVASR